MTNEHAIEDVSPSDVDVERLDYVVVAGKVYQIARNSYTDEAYFRPLDSVPDDYWARWEDDSQ